jgi:hypothetical protein
MDFRVSAQQEKTVFNSSVLAYEMNSVMAVVMATTETCQNMDSLCQNFRSKCMVHAVGSL